MSNVIMPEEFLIGYIREFQEKREPAWPNGLKDRTEFATKAAQAVMEGKHLITSLAYFRIDVIGEEKAGDCDCNWLLRVAFEHENPDWHCPDMTWGAPKRRPTWIQELCKLTHVVADLRVLAAYYDANKDDEELTHLLQRNVNRMQEHNRMTRVPDGKWLFIFGIKPPSDGLFRAFKLGGDNGTTTTELEIPS